MKIIFFVNHLNGGDGWSRYGKDLALEAKHQGHNVLCIVNKKSDTPLEQKELLKEPLEYLANPIRIYLSSRKINKAIKEFSPDVAHCIVEPYASLFVFLDIRKYKTILTIHGTYSYIPKLLESSFIKKLFSSFVFNKVYKKIDVIISVSEYTKKRFLRNFFDRGKDIIKKKLNVVINGVNLSEYKIIESNKKETNKVPYNMPYNIIFVGAVKVRKGINEALKGLKTYKEMYTNNFIYNIVGPYKKNDKYVQKLKKEIDEYGLKENVVFYGKISDEELNKMYLEADLFLMLPISNGNNFEGFGLVYLEANTKGVPCVGALNSAAEDAIKSGKSGYLANINDPKDIAKQIQKVLNEKEISAKDCIEWARENDIQIKAKQIFQLYE